ncbi:MAG: hypothetical protein E6968_14935 [Peptostreptococcaceae bacterium]|uniref:hypothetical protein n=1 Tax=Peptostreptococcus anaerobius TaxID=1261 RepID=UPI0012FDB745|nr:hypothetical protein [Peptostreptococcus anaerobius]MDU1255492.1 hypothetical protein [Peptostreptococcaceae bacterium]
MRWINDANEENFVYASSGCYTNFGNTCKKYKFCGKFCILKFNCKIQSNCGYYRK